MLNNKLPFTRPSIITKSDESNDTSGLKRRLLDEDNCQVSVKMLETTKINIQNPEHAKVHHLLPKNLHVIAFYRSPQTS